MVNILTVGTHISLGHGCANAITCTNPNNSKVTVEGLLAVNTTSPCVPHNFCGPDAPHIPVTLPSQTTVKVNGEPVNVDATPLGCGDILFSFAPSKVALFRNPGSNQVPGQIADRVAYISDYPKVIYRPSNGIKVIYKKEGFGEEAPYRADLFCRFAGSIPVRDAYTPIAVSSSAGITESRNYPGPPISSRSGAVGIPSYSTLNNPLPISLRILGVYGVAISSDNFLNRRERGERLDHNLQLDPNTLTISNLESIRLTPSIRNSILGKLFGEPIKAFLLIDYIPGFFYGDIFVEPPLLYPEQVDGGWTTNRVQSIGIGFTRQRGGNC